jgi:hypothetical protein
VRSVCTSATTRGQAHHNGSVAVDSFSGEARLLTVGAVLMPVDDWDNKPCNFSKQDSQNRNSLSRTRMKTAHPSPQFLTAILRTLLEMNFHASTPADRLIFSRNLLLARTKD